LDVAGFEFCKISTQRTPRIPRVPSTIISDVRGHEEIPFAEDDIARIEITHDKWDWKKEQ
jgi:hypothetical protein